MKEKNNFKMKFKNNNFNKKTFSTLPLISLILLTIFLSEITTSKLEFVQTITRHGDRVATKPIKAAPAYWYCEENTIAFPSEGNDEYTPIKYQMYRSLYINGRQSLLGNCTAGQLSSIGQNQTLSLGNLLAQEYVFNRGLLPGNYSSSSIYIRSSETSRCQQSARNIIEGMYPGIERANSLTIPIWLIEESEDDMQIDISTCPAVILKFISSIIHHPDDIIKIVSPLLPHLPQLKNIFNTSHPIISSLSNYDNCNCRNFHDIPLPNGMSNIIFNAIQKSYWFGGMVLFNSSADITLGPFIGELVDYLDQKIAGNLTENFQLFSGHDTTIAPILSYFELYDGVWPPYASHIQFNLLNDNSTYYIEMYYNNELMTIPQCGSSSCEYSLFRSIALSKIPSNPQTACEILPYLENFNLTLPLSFHFNQKNQFNFIEKIIYEHFSDFDLPLFPDNPYDNSSLLDFSFAFLRFMFNY